MKYALRYEKYPSVLEGTEMQIELQILRNQNQPADTYLHLEMQRYLRNKQTCITRSIMGSEFIALDKGGEEAEWLRQFL